MEKTAKWLSGIFSPLWIPTYAIIIILFTSYLVLVPVAMRWIVVVCVFAMTGLVPLGGIMILKRIGVVSNLDVTDRTQRGMPIVLVLICYIACSIFLQRAFFPMIVVDMIRGGAFAVVVQLLVNRWWKISGHGAGMGALAAMVLREAQGMITIVDLTWLFVAIVMLGGLIGSSRVLLGRHTAMQVIAGWINGYVSVLLMTL